MKTHCTFSKIILLTFTFLFMYSCSKDDDNVSYDLVGNWKVIFCVENGKKITKSDQNTWLDVNNGDITINFEALDNHGKGTFSGIAVSNTYSGEYLIQKQGEISIGPVITTFINQPDWTNII